MLVLDGDGNPRIGRKGGGMSVERVGFSPAGDVILGGTFTGAAALGLEGAAVGVRDVWYGTFDATTLQPVHHALWGTPEIKTVLASDWLESEVGGGCSATDMAGGFAIRADDRLTVTGIGENGVACAGAAIPAGGGETRSVTGADGNMFFWLPKGSGITWGPPGNPTENTWPPIDDWEATAGSSRARFMNNAR